MADPNARARAAVATRGAAPTGTATVPRTVADLLRQDAVKARFEDILGKRSAGFLSSVLTTTNNSALLKRADPATVLSAAAIAAALDLPIDPNLGFAYIVPYEDRRAGTVVAQFQLGYRGYTQLALRTGQYATIHADVVYDGEIEPLTARERLTGEIRFSESGKTSDKVVGYCAYFRLLNGFEKWDYWTAEQIIAHATKYSAAYKYGKGPWHDTFEAMAIKTPVRHLLGHYGILSIDMQMAMSADQAVVRGDLANPTFDYADGAGSVDTTATEVPATATPTPETPVAPPSLADPGFLGPAREPGAEG